MKKLSPVLLTLCLFAVSPFDLASAQTPPGTDILLVELRQGTLITDTLINLTERDGYDNQPFFTPDGESLLYTSIREDGQADIYRIDLATRDQHQVTQTSESEYSPTPLPDGTGFSAVRVEADRTQRLWRFDDEGQSPTLVLDHVQPVGYHAWANAQTVALFILGDSLSPNTLQLADVRTGRTDTLATNIGRSLHRVPTTHLISFVHKETADTWMIKTVDPATQTVRPVVETLPGREDYAWRPDGSLLMADGPILYLWTPGAPSWTALHNFSDAGVTQITRLAVNPQGTRLALVMDRP